MHGWQNEKGSTMNNDHSNVMSCRFNTDTVNPVKKASSTIKYSVAHNRRTTQAAYGSRSNIDPKRTHLNYCLEGDASPSAIVEKVQAGMIKHQARKNAPHAVESLLSLPVAWEGNLHVLCLDTVAYLKTKLGADNLLSADVHLDESNRHMHVLFIPLEYCEKKGRLVWRSTINKRTREIYDGFFSEVGVKHGLVRPFSLTAPMRVALAKAVIDTMIRSGDKAMQSIGWEAFKKSIHASPEPYAALYGIDLKAFTESQKSLGSCATYDTDAITKLPSCVCSFESNASPIDLETGEIKLKRPFSNTFNSAPDDGATAVKITRVRESEFDSALFDPLTGEFHTKPSKQIPNNRAMADNWVKAALHK